MHFFELYYHDAGNWNVNYRHHEFRFKGCYLQQSQDGIFAADTGTVYFSKDAVCSHLEVVFFNRYRALSRSISAALFPRGAVCAGRRVRIRDRCTA